jgi:cytochrome c553
MRALVTGLFAIIGMALLLGNTGAGEKAEFKIKDVMQKAMKGGICAKVAKGTASDDEKADLVKYFTALTQNTPPMGEKDSWTKRTTALLDASKGAAKGDEKAAKSLQKLANCATCHKEFKK